MRVGVIGCGRWGQNHARTLAAMTVLEAAADTDAARRHDIAARHGVRSCTTEEILLDPAIGAVVVSLPPLEQPGVALQVLAAGKHLLVEKPMALDLALAERLVTTAQAMRLVAMTGHLLLFHPAYRQLAAVVRSGRLGAVRHIRTLRCGQGSFYPGTDALWDLLPHDLALIRDLTGRWPDRGTLQKAAVVGGLADVASLQMAYETGLTVDCHVSRVAPERERRLIVQGSEATIVWDDTRDWPQKLTLTTTRAGAADDPAGLAAVHIPVAPAEALRLELEHFLGCIASGARPLASVADGLEVLRFLDLYEPAGAFDRTAADMASAGIAGRMAAPT